MTSILTIIFKLPLLCFNGILFEYFLLESVHDSILPKRCRKYKKSQTFKLLQFPNVYDGHRHVAHSGKLCHFTIARQVDTNVTWQLSTLWKHSYGPSRSMSQRSISKRLFISLYSTSASSMISSSSLRSSLQRKQVTSMIDQMSK